MRQRRKKRSLLKALKQTTVEVASLIKYGIAEELDKMALILQILTPVLIAQSDATVIQMILMSGVFIFAIHYIRELWCNLNYNTDDKIPVPAERFTYTDDRGFIKVSNMQEAIVYLNDLENSMEKKGWLNIDK